MELLALITPSVNRVYGAKAPDLAIAELSYVLDLAVPGLLVRCEQVSESGVDYLRFTFDDELIEDVENFAHVSYAFAYSPHIFAAFEVMGRMPVTREVPTPTSAASAPNAHGGSARGAVAPESSAVKLNDGGVAAGEERVFVDELASAPILLPLQLPLTERYPSDLLTTLKYQGKTNEQFTALMLHLAAHVAGGADQLRNGTLAVLDPVAGRGTTLNQAIMWGLSPIGVDIDKKDAELYRAFLTAWMRENRLKHTSRTSKLTVKQKALGQHFEASLALSKEAQKAGREQRVDLFTADTSQVASFVKPRSLDVIVADLPYGVQHGSRSQGALKRSPLELLEGALGAWRGTLRKGGAMALAINRHTAPWDAVESLLAHHRFEVVNEDGQFRHRVDASIDRDIVLARAL